MGLFGAAHEWGEGGKKAPFPKSCHTYPTMMNLDTATPYLKKTQKYINHVTHPLSSADINIFSSEISNFCYIHRLHNFVILMINDYVISTFF